MTSFLRYKQQLRIVQDADDVESWITVRGNHIPIKKGQSKEDAVEEFLFKKKEEAGYNVNTVKHEQKEKAEKAGFSMSSLVEKKKKIAEATHEYNNANGEYEQYSQWNKERKEESNKQDPRPKNADAETINDVLFNKYVPKQGKADTLLGEQLRAINKIVYRYENDGDMYGNGYGVETVNAPIKFLQSVYEEKSIPGLSGILSSLKNAAKFNDTTEYEYNIQRLKNVMVNADWETLKKLANTKNDEDMYSFEDKTRYDEEDEEW